MSATGILRAEHVVFYHPLDDFVEHTQDQTWTGNGGFTGGKIGVAGPLGLSAVSGDAFSWGAPADFIADAQGGGWFTSDLVALDDSTVVVLWMKNGTYDIHSKVGKISGTGVSFGPDATAQTDAFRYSADRLDATHILLAAGHGHARVGTVSGSDITWGPEKSYGAEGDTTSHSVRCISSTSFVVAWNFGANVYAHAGVVSGTNITLGARTTVTTAQNAGDIARTTVTVFNGTTVAIGAITGGTLQMRVCTVSGTDITVGPETGPSLASTYIGATTVALTSTSIVTLVNGKAVAGVRSGTSIAWGADVSFGTVSTVAGYSMTKLDSTHACICFCDATGAPYPGKSRIITVSGTNVTLGSLSGSYSGSKTGYSNQCDAIGSSKVAVLWVDGYLSGNGAVTIGSLDMEAQMQAPTPGAYPSTVGDTRVVAALWATNPTAGGTTVEIERGYEITLAGTAITLGGATATWSAAWVAAMMSSSPGGMNDGSDHLLVLDFENSGTDWTLRTSVDGGAFDNRGAQDSGSQAVTTADTAPRLAILDASGGTQWIDEMVLWSGDKSQFQMFTSEELANLRDLADVFGDPMDQYEEDYGAPICWQATARMPDGSVWRDSGCGPCPPVVRVPRGASDVVVTDDGAAASPRIVEG